VIKCAIFGCWNRAPNKTGLCVLHRAAQGTSASGQDRNGLEAKPAGPVLEEDAPNG
jgi:hypothetical protein